MNVRRIRGPGARRQRERGAAARADASAAVAAAIRRARSGHADGSVRLSKRMSELGLASRREADEWIARGWVRVDGRVVAELGSRVLPSQRITIDARARNAQAQLVTVLLNKPVGYVSGQAEDGYQPARVLVTRERQWREDRSRDPLPRRSTCSSLVPAGRLDIDSVGLLVLTQDGRIAKQLDRRGRRDREGVPRARRDARPARRCAPDKLALLRHGLEPRRRGAAAGAGRVAQRRPAALRPARKARSGRSAACARRSACRCSA